MRRWRKQRKGQMTREEIERQKDEARVRAKARYDENRDHVKKLAAKSRAKHRAQRRADTREWRKRNAEQVRAYNQNYFEKNAGYFAERAKRLYSNDPKFRIAVVLRSRLYSVLSRRLQLGHKSESVLRLVGCTLEQLMEHLQSQFAPGMSWNNYGAWHIDHVRPCASFNLTDPEQQRRCFHYTNLQPLWALDNIRKGRKACL